MPVHDQLTPSNFKGHSYGSLVFTRLNPCVSSKNVAKKVQRLSNHYTKVPFIYSYLKYDILKKGM